MQYILSYILKFFPILQATYEQLSSKFATTRKGRSPLSQFFFVCSNASLKIQLLSANAKHLFPVNKRCRVNVSLHIPPCIFSFCFQDDVDELFFQPYGCLDQSPLLPSRRLWHGNQCNIAARNNICGRNIYIAINKVLNSGDRQNVRFDNFITTMPLKLEILKILCSFLLYKNLHTTLNKMNIFTEKLLLSICRTNCVSCLLKRAVAFFLC